MMRSLPRLLLSLATAATLALVGVLPAGAVGPSDVSRGEVPVVEDPGPRLRATPGAQHVRTLDLTDAAGERTAAAAAGTGAGVAGVAVLTRALAVPEFVVAAVTWDLEDALPSDAVITLRVREEDGWSEWLETGVDRGVDAGPAVAAGTEPFVTGGASAVQLRVTGNPADLPADMNLVLVSVDPEAQADDRAPEAPGAGTAVGGRFGPVGLDASVLAVAVRSASLVPATTVTGDDWTTLVDSVVTRAEWGLSADDEAYTDLNWTPRYFPLQAAVVHHTAGTNRYTAEESAGIVKAIWDYHTGSRGWGDIGYNYLVDQHGQIFEGRKYSLPSSPPFSASSEAPAGWMIEAGHSAGFNKGTLGISAMGDFTKRAAPATGPIESAMAQVISWRFDLANLDPAAGSGFISPATKSTSTYPTGTELPRIFAHGDVAATLCPGDLYDELGALREAVSYARAEDTAAPAVAASRGAGTYPSGTEIELTTNEDSASIYYTVDYPDVSGGMVFSSPSLPSTLYSVPLALTSDMTLTYVAVDAVGNTSAPVVQRYTVGDAVPDTTPPVVTADPVGGEYGAGTEIRLTADEPATIYYTTDGSIPGAPASTKTADTAVELTLTETFTLMYDAVDAAGNASETAVQVYELVEDPPVAENAVPVADPGDAQTVAPRTTVTLDGSGSSDPDGDPLSYSWTQTGGKSVTLSDPTAVDPFFWAQTPGTYTFELVVNDGALDSAPDDVVITVSR